MDNKPVQTTIYVTNKTGVKGVFFDNNNNTYRAEAWFDGRRYSLGCYRDLQDAIKARRQYDEVVGKCFFELYNSVKQNGKSKKTEKECQKSKNKYSEYIDNVAKASNMTRKEYLTHLIKQDMLVHPDIIETMGGDRNDITN